MRTGRFWIGVLVVLLGAGQFVSAQQVLRVTRDLDVPAFIGYVPDELILVLAESAQPLDVKVSPAGLAVTGISSFDELGKRFATARIKKQFPHRSKDNTASATANKLARYYKVKFSPGNLEQALQAYSAHPLVERTEPIGIHTVSLTPNDPFYQDSPDPSFLFDQWHYWDTAGIDADLAWDSETGDPNVIVAVLDTGARYFHIDLGGNNPVWGPDNPMANGNIWINTAEVPGNALDDDGNGKVDDTIGWDFVSSAGGGGGISCVDQDCGTVDNDPDDGHGHGTHVSGTIAAITNNNFSVAGVAGGFAGGSRSSPGNGVKILPLRIGYRARVRGTMTGIVRMDWAAEAMEYVSDMIDRHGLNVAAINCSWGSSDSGGLDAAVDNLLAHDVMIIHAAGNDNSTVADFLGLKAGVMNVSATDNTGAGASFTSYGPWVDLAAPGVDILSTFANPTDPDLTSHYISIMSGTSMAAPHACGVAALLESFAPSLSGPDKFTLMVDNTTAYNDSRDLGSGILNANNALLAVPGPVQISGSLQTITGNGIAGVLVSADNGGGTDLSDPNGDYSLTVPSGWLAGTVTVDKARWTFGPNQISYPGPVTVDQIDQDYTGRAWADFDLDGVVDANDLRLFVANWLRADCTEPNNCQHTDLDLSGNVDLFDWSLFEPRWGLQN